MTETLIHKGFSPIKQRQTCFLGSGMLIYKHPSPGNVIKGWHQRKTPCTDTPRSTRLDSIGINLLGAMAMSKYRGWVIQLLRGYDQPCILKSTSISYRRQWLHSYQYTMAMLVWYSRQLSQPQVHAVVEVYTYYFILFPLPPYNPRISLKYGGVAIYN